LFSITFHRLIYLQSYFVIVSLVRHLPTAFAPMRVHPLIKIKMQLYSFFQFILIEHLKW